MLFFFSYSMLVVLHCFYFPVVSIFVVGQVVLPEGSKDIEVSAPFPTNQSQEVISHRMM